MQKYIFNTDHYKGLAFTGSYREALFLDWYISHYPIKMCMEKIIQYIFSKKAIYGKIVNQYHN